MSIPKNKVRRSITFSKETLDYLEKRSKEESKHEGKTIHISTILERLIQNDQTIRETFR